jgi:hypothetical protein
MEYLLVLVAIVLAGIVYEYRLRKPDQTVVFGTRDGVGVRSGLAYPRHFSLAIRRTTHAFSQTIDASAKGNLDIRVKLAVAVAPSPDHLGALVRVGGWSPDAVAKAARELETALLGFVKQYAERLGLEEISSDGLRQHLAQRIPETRAALGIDVVTLTVASVDPVNPQIAEAIREREHARILEQSETYRQRARIAAARTRIEADEEIALMENELELKKADLKRQQLEKDAALAGTRAEHDLRVKRMQLDFEKDELRLLRDSPELLLLTPQAARLAEASQALKNAKTVVSVGAGEAGQGTEILGLFQSLLQNALDAYRKKKER